jgi:uncharacterized protein (TIGR02996 family)
MNARNATLRAFLTDIADQPEDDTLRLILADWLTEQGDARGDLIRVQCRLARMAANAGERAGFEDQEQQSINAVRATWTGEQPVELWFLRGLLGVRVGQESFRTQPMRDWWASQRRWITSLHLAPCDDALFKQLLEEGSLDFVTHLNLSGTRITDATLKDLPGVAHLRSLHLWGTAITDKGLTGLRKLGRLESLDLSHTRIGDWGLAYLARAPALLSLTLSGTNVTDQGIVLAGTIPHLKELFLRYSRVTPAGLVRLQTICPRLRVVGCPE